LTPSKVPRLEAAPLEAQAAAAWAEIIPSELFVEELVAVDDPHAGLHPRFAGIAPASLAHDFMPRGVERSLRLDGGIVGTWHTSWAREKGDS
jgi:hypothetical protein